MQHTNSAHVQGPTGIPLGPRGPAAPFTPSSPGWPLNNNMNISKLPQISCLFVEFTQTSNQTYLNL